MEKTFVLLADSYKNGHCIAGKGIDDNIWFRPVNKDVSVGLSEKQIEYEDGTQPRLLDIIKIGLSTLKIEKHQTENYLLDDSVRWKKVGDLSMEQLDALCDSANTIWNNTENSSKGINDRIPECFENSIKNSLLLVKLSKSIMTVSQVVDSDGKQKKDTRIAFSLNGKNYKIAFKDRNNPYYCVGEYPINTPHYVTISLGLPFYGYCYLIAAGLIR